MDWRKKIIIIESWPLFCPASGFGLAISLKPQDGNYTISTFTNQTIQSVMNHTLISISGAWLANTALCIFIMQFITLLQICRHFLWILSDNILRSSFVFNFQFSWSLLIMFIILDSHYHPSWPLAILHDHHPILQDDHDQGVSLRHCLALGGGLVTGWGVAQTALHYYWFRWWGIVMAVWHSLMLVQTMRMTDGGDSDGDCCGKWIDDRCDNCCPRASPSSLFPTFLHLPPSFSRLANTLFLATRISI